MSRLRPSRCESPGDANFAEERMTSSRVKREVGAHCVDAEIHPRRVQCSRDKRVRSARWFICLCLSVASTEQNGVGSVSNCTTSYFIVSI